SNGRASSLHASADTLTCFGLLDDDEDGTDGCAYGADDVAMPRPKLRKLRFQMIADTSRRGRISGGEGAREQGSPTRCRTAPSWRVRVHPHPRWSRCRCPCHWLQRAVRYPRN